MPKAKPAPANTASPEDRPLKKPRKRKSRAKPNPQKGGRKPHIPTGRQREQVEAMFGMGIPANYIAALIGVSETTIKDRYMEEMRLGAIKAKVQVVGALFKKCIGGDINAIKLYLGKMWRDEWGESMKIEHSGAIGSYDLTRLTDKELDDFERLARKAAAAGSA